MTLAIDAAAMSIMRPGFSPVALSGVISMIVDKLGADVETVSSRDSTIRVYARMAPSPEFYSWMFQMSDLVQLETPKRVVKEYHGRLRRACPE